MDRDLEVPRRTETEPVASADLTVVYSGQVDDVLRAADSPQPGRTLDLLFEMAKSVGVTTATTVLDVGCATGWRSRRLINETGCCVEGIEYLPQLVEWGREQTLREELQDRLTFEVGSILDLPRPDRSYDVVWCTDVLGIIGDLDRAIDECARVLRPGGVLIGYVSVATVRMATAEQAELDRGQGCVAASMNRENLERSFRRHFSIEQAVSLGAEHVLAAVDGGDDTALRNLGRAARLATWPDSYRGIHGPTAFEAARTEALWNVYQLLGKIDPVLYQLRRQTQSEHDEPVVS